MHAARRPVGDATARGGEMDEDQHDAVEADASSKNNIAPAP
jgi:hypothetical protein